MENKKESYLEYCQQHAIDNLFDCFNDGDTVYGCDLASNLTMGINVDGSATCSRHEALEYIREWRYEAGEVYEYLKSNLDMTINPFENSEKFHVLMIIFGVENLIAQCSTINNKWDDEIKMTATMKKKIKSELLELTSIAF